MIGTEQTTPQGNRCWAWNKSIETYCVSASVVKNHLQNDIKELSVNKLRKIAAGILSSGGAGKPQECLLPFKVLPCHMAAKSQGKMCKLFTDSS